MKYYSFQIVIEKEEDGGGYYAYAPGLPGCFSNGSTIKDARRNMRQAIKLHVRALREHGVRG